MTGLRYVYAVCRPFGAALQSQLTGVAGDPPRLLPHGGLVAVVSHVPEADFSEEALRAHLEDLDWLAGTARAHQQVIDALTVVTTPLPLRLATVFRDDSGVRTMMEEREESFRRILDRLEGRVEWGVKIYVESAPTRPPAGRSPPRSPPRAGTTCGSGAGRRGERRPVEQGRGVREPPARDPLPPGRRRTAAPAAESRPLRCRRTERPQRRLFGAARRLREFVEMVDRTKDDAPGIRVELTGPWAAYSFAGEEGTGEGA